MVTKILAIEKMNIINWKDFNGDKFQSFCNDLLSFEFGKSYIPFSAPGPDQGIDGIFEGEYNGEPGKWRFQAKFHDADTGRVAGIDQLKSQIKQDLDKNLRDETIVVFITNVEINPSQRKKLIGLAYDCIKQKNKQVRFDIWDGAKINALLAQHPIVKLWYTSEAKHLIQEYSEFFQRELNSDTSTSYELSNKFYHRQEKLADLEKFIHDDSKNIAIINGEAGIGKTRLCIEFFKQYMDQTESWVALVLITHQINLEVLQKALTGKKNYIVFIDDADKFDERDITDIITLVKGFKENKVKLLITVRNCFLKKVLSQISINNRTTLLQIIELSQLSKEETVQFLEGELYGYRIAEYLGYFVELTHGVPIMIMTLLKVIKGGTRLNNIKEDSFLKKYVEQLFDNFSATTSKENDLQKKTIDKIVKLVALIEPIQIDNSDLIHQIARTEVMPVEDVEIILQALKKQNILSGRYQFTIKPDIYSDLILEEALKSRYWLKSKLPEYGLYLNNIIKNIGYVYQYDDNNSILEMLLKWYIDQIDGCSNSQELSRILETVYSITFPMPLLATEAVNKTISIYSNENHPLYADFQQGLVYKNYSLDSTINSLKSILRSLFQIEDHYISSFSYSGKLFQILNDEGVVTNIANFNKSDIYNEFTCKQQNRVLSESRKVFEKKERYMMIFALRTLKAILKLEFVDTETHLFQKYSLQVYTIYIPENNPVKNLRKEAIDILIKVFNDESNKEFRDEILRIIVDIPREIFTARKKNYNGNNEIETVLNFLFTISLENILELKQKQLLKDQLYWFKRWGIDASHYEIIEKIIANLSENDLAGTLLDILNPKFEGDIDEKRKLYEQESQILFENNSGTNLANALVKVIEQSEYPPHYFYSFLEMISSDLEKIKEFIDHLWVKNKTFIINYCSVLFRNLRFLELGGDFYWSYIGKLKNENSIESRNCILHIYNSFSISDIRLKLQNATALQKKDVELIISTCKISTVDNYFQLAYTLPTLFFYDKKIAMQEIKTYLTKCNERHLDTLFLSFDPIKNDNYLEIKELLLKHTLYLNIPYTIERILNQIVDRNGFKEVLKYFENRLLVKRKYVTEKKSLIGYDFVPKHTGKVIINDLSMDKKTEIFKEVLIWYVNFDFEPYEYLYAKDIIELFTTHKYIDEGSKVFYIELIEKYKSDYKRLLNIIYSLSEFEEKNDDFVDLIIKLLEASFDNFQDNTLLKEITTQCYISLTSLGVKSGTPGQPFSVDMQLKELLERTLTGSKVKTMKVKDFFLQVLKSVQADIDRAKNDESNELW